DPSGDAQPALADRSEVDVVLEGHVELELLSQGGPEGSAFDARDVRRQGDLAVLPGDCARYADNRAVDRRAVEPRSPDDRPAERIDRSERLGGVCAGDLDVLARSDRALEIADRAAEKACAEVEPEDERGLRDRLEVRGAVPRAAGIGRGLAHEPRIEKRL